MARVFGHERQNWRRCGCECCTSCTRGQQQTYRRNTDGKSERCVAQQSSRMASSRCRRCSCFDTNVDSRGNKKSTIAFTRKPTRNTPTIGSTPPSTTPSTVTIGIVAKHLDKCRQQKSQFRDRSNSNYLFHWPHFKKKRPCSEFKKSKAPTT